MTSYILETHMFNSVGNKELLSKKVAFEIENAIIQGKLIVGSKLPTEIELCSQFEVSRTSLREALKILSAKGLVSVEKGRGIFVAELNSKNVTDPLHYYLKHKLGIPYVLDIIEARLIIEPDIAKVAAMNRSQADIIILREDIEKYRLCIGEASEVAHLDMTFHLDIANATKNKLLPLMLKPIFKLMPDIKAKILADVPEAHSSALVWHTKIVDELEKGNAQGTYEMMKEHLLLAREHAERMLKIEGLSENKRLE